MSTQRFLPALPERDVVIDLLPEPPTDFRKPMITGLAVIGLALGGFAAWASLAPLDGAVVTQGVVSVESKRKIVQHKDGGIVAEVLVREGDTVKAGALLVRLADADAEARMATIKDQIDAKSAQRARLTAERDGRAAIAFPADLEARRSEPKLAEILEREEDRFAQRRATIEGKRAILTARIEQLASQQDGRSGLEDSKRRQLDLLRDEIAGLRDLHAKGFFATNKLRERERELARMQGEMLNDGAGADQSASGIAETKLEILQAEQTFRDDVVAELIKTESEINDLGRSLIAARDSVERLAVVAPVTGTVQNLAVAGPGAVVAPNGAVAELVPENDRLVIEAHISPQDIDRVYQGQDAALRFVAFNARATPVIDGAVAVVSADRNTDEKTREAFYTARIEVAEEQTARLPGTLKAGMPVEVMLEEGTRTPLQYFIKPLMDSFARSFKES